MPREATILDFALSARADELAREDAKGPLLSPRIGREKGVGDE
jgi:hypothetical protein